jgi:hypothetical protein
VQGLLLHEGVLPGRYAAGGPASLAWPYDVSAIVMELVDGATLS